MTELVTADSFVDAGLSDGCVDCSSDNGLVQVMATCLVGSGIDASGARGEYVLPAPVDGCLGVLPVECRGHVDAAEAVSEVLLMEIGDLGEMILEPLSARGWKKGRSILVALAVSDGDGAKVEVYVLDAEAEAFEDAHPGPVEEHDDQLNGAFETIQE